MLTNAEILEVEFADDRAAYYRELNTAKTQVLEVIDQSNLQDLRLILDFLIEEGFIRKEKNNV